MPILSPNPLKHDFHAFFTDFLHRASSVPQALPGRSIDLRAFAPGKKAAHNTDHGVKGVITEGRSILEAGQEV